MDRKSFIRNSAIAATVPLFLGALPGCNNYVAKNQKKVLVLLQLIGGNDGLNTIIPLSNFSALAEARPKLCIPENKILSLRGTNEVGLHPALGGIKDMYDNKLISFVQGVGYSNLAFSHFRSQDIWLTGSDTQILSTGWMARFLESRYKNYPTGFPDNKNPDPLAIKIGDTGTFLFQGHDIDMSVLINPTTGFQAPDVEEFTDQTSSFAALEMKSIEEVLMQTQRYSPVLKGALNSAFAHSKMYPENGTNLLADQLKIVARLISSGLQTSVYMVDLKGFDTHQEQVDSSDPTKGQHADLLTKLSQAITCFWDDVVTMGRENDVVGMTFSEFGRRIMPNASLGTDHGSSQPLLFFGKGIIPGVVGVNPEIPDKVTVEDNLPLQFDYRSIYASVLKKWLSADPSVITDVLHGNFPQVKIFR